MNWRALPRPRKIFSFHYLQAQRKGLMTKADLKVRLKFAKDIIKNEGFWSSYEVDPLELDWLWRGHM